jgi:hypothetical protein
LAVLRPSGGEASLIITDLSTRQESMKAESLDEYGALSWASDSQQLFYTENSYLQSSTLIGRYTVSDGRWETHTIPVGDGLAAIAVEPEEAPSARAPAAATRVAARALVLSASELTTPQCARENKRASSSGHADGQRAVC